MDCRRVMFGAVLWCSMGILTGCDPEALVKEKTPPLLKELLTSSTMHKRQTTPVDQMFKITAPTENESFIADTEISFSAQYTMPDPNMQKPELTWTVFGPKPEKKEQIGKGETVKKRLGAGSYRLEVSGQLGERKGVQKTEFRLGYFQKGRLTLTGGGPLGEAQVAVADSAGSRLGAYSSKADGSFVAEFPKVDVQYILIPQKSGYTFTPLSQTAVFKRDAPEIKFEAYQGELADVRLTEEPEGEFSTLRACPGKELYLKFKPLIVTKPKSISATLVHEEKSVPVEILSNLEDAREDSAGRKVIQVRIPKPAAFGLIQPTYEVHVALKDEHGREYPSRLPTSVHIEPFSCFEHGFAAARNAQREGKSEEAENQYLLLDHLFRNAPDVGYFNQYMDAVYMNRGIIALEKALENETDPASQGMFRKAAQDFAQALKFKKRDVEALLLHAIANTGRNAPQEAFTEIDNAIEIDPILAEAYELRGRLFLNTGLKRNLLKAIADFSKCIELRGSQPSPELREARAAALKLYLKSEKPGKIDDNEKMDTSKIRLRSLKDMIEPKQYIRHPFTK